MDHWQHTVREQLRLNLSPALPGDDLDAEVADYLDHHGELVRTMMDVQDDEADGCVDHAEVCAMAREILHRHLLIVTMLLEKVDAHQAHRVEAEWMATQQTEVPDPG